MTDLVVSLANPQVILGTVWLKGMGPSLWDFGSHTLSLWAQGRRITLQGVQSHPLKVMKGETIDKLLQLKDIAFVVQLVDDGKMSVRLPPMTYKK